MSGQIPPASYGYSEVVNQDMAQFGDVYQEIHITGVGMGWLGGHYGGVM